MLPIKMPKSKTFQLSFRYFLGPSADIFITASRANTPVNMKFISSVNVVQLSGYLYHFKARIIVFSMIEATMNDSKYLLEYM